MSDNPGSARITEAFRARRRAGQIALAAYVTVGYPSLAATAKIVSALAGAGVDAVELGIPFSDPLADGPTIQAASSASLARGTNVAACLATAAGIRAARPELPLLFLGYYNPILQYGPARFVEASRQVGVDGFIVPDLPLEEAEELDGLCREAGLGIIPQVAPATTAERVRLQATRRPAFIYVAARLGMTATCGALPPDLPDLLARVRAETDAPLGVGFDNARPDDVSTLRPLADAAIVGSALLDAIGTATDPAGAAAAFIAPLVAAAHGD